MRNCYYHLCRIFFLLPLLLFSVNGFSIPARPAPVCVTQPDGTKVYLYVNGDEHYHYLTSEDGYLVLEEENTYVYAVKNSVGDWIKSSCKVTPPGKRSEETKLFVEALDKYQPAVRNKTSFISANGIIPAIFPHKILVILAEFASPSVVLDYSFVVPEPQQTFTRLFNEEGYFYDGATGSVRDYYIENSMGTYQPDFTVVGPVKLPEAKGYYGTNIAGGRDKAPGTMVYDACVAVAESGEIDFSEYDSDGDGFVDAVIVVYSGLSEAEGAPGVNIWPLAATLEEMDPYEENSIYPLELNGVIINRFIAVSELRGAEGTDIVGIGMVTHEIGHLLGLPDLYNTINTGGGLMDWTIMAHGGYNNEGRTPPYFSAFERETIGWAVPTVLDENGSHELETVSSNNYYRINTSVETEYFLLENRQQIGWDSYIKGHGMIIYHIDLSDPEAFLTNKVNIDEEHFYVNIKVADGILDKNSYPGDPFPGTTGKTAFSDTTIPSSKLWSGEPLNKALSNIEETEDGKIVFDFEDFTITSIERTNKYKSIYTSDNILYIEITEGPSLVEVYNSIGVKIKADRLIDNKLSLSLPGGQFYLVKIGNDVYKVIN